MGRRHDRDDAATRAAFCGSREWLSVIFVQRGESSERHEAIVLVHDGATDRYVTPCKRVLLVYLELFACSCDLMLECVLKYKSVGAPPVIFMGLMPSVTSTFKTGHTRGNGRASNSG
eukprot:COSAG02_NODE_3173_length_7227_cov_35.536336_9_plen_117_part_00